MELISIPEPIPNTKSIPEPFPVPESIPESIPELIPEPIEDPIMKPIPILEPIPEPVPESIPISEPIPESTPETDPGPTIRNRFQKTAELAGIDSDKNFIFPITTTQSQWARVDVLCVSVCVCMFMYTLFRGSGSFY